MSRARTEDEMTPEDEARTTMYFNALADLVKHHPRFGSNFRRYIYWNTAERIWWINIIEAQARAGANTIGTEVVTKAVEVRLR